MILSQKLREDLAREDIWVENIADLFREKDIGEVLRELVHKKYAYNIYLNNGGGDTYSCITLFKGSYVIRLEGEDFEIKRVWKEIT